MTTKKNGKTEKPATREADLSRKIVLLTRANPHGEGTAAREVFESMRGRPSIRKYLEKFPEEYRRTARRWLWNQVKWGNAETRD